MRDPRRRGVADDAGALDEQREHEQGWRGRGELDRPGPERVGGVPDPALAERAELRPSTLTTPQSMPTCRPPRPRRGRAPADAGHPDHEAEDLHPGEPLTEEHRRQQGGEHRAERVHQRGEGGAEARVEGEVHRAELDAVEHEARQPDPDGVGPGHPQRPAEDPRQHPRDQRRRARTAPRPASAATSPRRRRDRRCSPRTRPARRQPPGRAGGLPPARRDVPMPRLLSRAVTGHPIGPRARYRGWRGLLDSAS